MTGIEPAKCSLEGRCNNHYAPSALKYSEDGFEPPTSAINIAVLPLNYSRILMVTNGIEPLTKAFGNAPLYQLSYITDLVSLFLSPD